MYLVALWFCIATWQLLDVLEQVRTEAAVALFKIGQFGNHGRRGAKWSLRCRYTRRLFKEHSAGPLGSRVTRSHSSEPAAVSSRFAFIQEASTALARGSNDVVRVVVVVGGGRWKGSV